MKLAIRKQQLAGLTILFAALLILTSTQPTHSQAVKSKEDIERIVVIEKLTVRDGVVSGEALNRSSNTLRDVQLFIRSTWLWDDEMKPGETDPGRSTYYTLPKEMPPGERLPFTFKPEPPLPNIARGHFETSATIAAFTEVIQQKK